MTYASDLFDERLLSQMIREGYVRRTEHPYEQLVIYNYTPKAQYENEWNDVTTACRGLIVDGSGLVYARPFPKFFNWDQMGAPKLPVGPVRVAAKMDGSLGILYTVDGESAIATRGSFTSDQAVRGTEIFRENAKFVGFEPVANRTYLFEIIYPENRIVVDYKGEERLVLLDVIDNDTGRSDLPAFDAAMWFDKVDWKMLPGFDHRLIETIPDGDEGLVFYWHHDNVRVKMKAAEYVRLHRIVTQTSSRTIWQHLSEGNSLASLLEHVPDEFYEWVERTADELWDKYQAIDTAATLEYFQIGESISWDDVGGIEKALTNLSSADWRREYRKRFAAKASKSEYRDLLFARLDGKSWRSLIWKRLRPEYSKAFALDEEVS